MDLLEIKDKLNNYKSNLNEDGIVGLVIGRIRYVNHKGKNIEIKFNHVGYDNRKKKYIFIEYEIKDARFTNNIRKEIAIDETKIISYCDIPFFIET